MRRILRILFLIFALALITSVITVSIQNINVELTNYDIRSDNLPMAFYGYRIMVIADYHNSYYHKQISDMINKHKPDALIFLGDLTTLPENATDNLEKLMADISHRDMPVYGVTGGHEYNSADSHQVITRITAAGITFLDNAAAVLTRDGEQIYLFGASDTGLSDEQIFGSEALHRLRGAFIESLPGDAFSIIACHNASMYPHLSDLSAELMLAGNTHGGVVRLPGIGGLFGGDGGFLPKYDAGLFQEGDMRLLVSRGCDFSILRPRVFNPPEILQITLLR